MVLQQQSQQPKSPCYKYQQQHKLHGKKKHKMSPASFHVIKPATAKLKN